MHRNQAQPRRSQVSRTGRKPRPALRVEPGKRRPRRKLPGVRQQHHRDFVWTTAASQGQLKLLSTTQKVVPARIAALIRPRPDGQTRPLATGERIERYLRSGRVQLTRAQARRFRKKRHHAQARTRGGT